MLDTSLPLLTEPAASVATGTLLFNRGDAVDRIVHVIQGRVVLGVMADGQMAHQLGLQLYSPYRRAVAIRNLRWLLHQPYVPLDLRLKELIKMLLKPWLWLLLEPNPRRTCWSIWVGLTAPLLRPFPRQRLGARA